MKNNIIIFILLSVLFGCSKSGEFKMEKIAVKQLQNMKVVGFGTGSSAREEMALQKAKMNAQLNLVDQINGRDFSYQKANGNMRFKSSSRGMLKATELVNSYDLPEGKKLVVLATSMPEMQMDNQEVYLMRTNFTTTELEKSIEEYYRLAVEEITAKYYSQKNDFTGKLFLHQIDLSELNEAAEFELKLEILILIKN